MKLIDAIDLVATVRPAWKGGGSSFQEPHCFNRNHALRLLGKNTDVRKIKKADLAVMRVKLQNESGQKGKRSPASCNRIMSFINCTLSELVELEVLKHAPSLKRLPENNTKEEYYTKAEVFKMMEEAVLVFNNQALADAILFAAYTGCRQDELLSLKVGDVCLDKAQITFKDTKNGLDHTLEIHHGLYSTVEKRVLNRRDDEMVFTEFKNDDQLRRQFYKVRDYIGKSNKYNWHSFRHTVGTWLAESGVPLQTIAKVLNHKNPMTSARYAKVTDKARKAAVEAL